MTPDPGAAIDISRPVDCFDCGPSAKLRVVELRADQRFFPDAPLVYRLECPGCGGWWVLTEDKRFRGTGLGKIPPEAR